jgi:hypothetical protein
MNQPRAGGDKDGHHHHAGPNGAGSSPNGNANGGSREMTIAASERAQNSGILKLRGLPFSSNKQDLQQFFEGAFVFVCLFLRAGVRACLAPY